MSRYWLKFIGMSISFEVKILLALIEESTFVSLTCNVVLNSPLVLTLNKAYSEVSCRTL